jgi:hypothetical protein
VINLSTEKPRDALKYKQQGFDVVITNTSVFDLAVYSVKHRKQPANIVCNGESVKVVPCPEQYTEALLVRLANYALGLIATSWLLLKSTDVSVPSLLLLCLTLLLAYFGYCSRSTALPLVVSWRVFN